jgi:hypothetical protein
MKDSPSYYLGTALKITTTLNIDTATSCTITIDDPTLSEVVSSQAMTQEANKVYSYVFQSSTAYTEGVFTITITVVSGAYTSVTQDSFTLVKQL